MILFDVLLFNIIFTYAEILLVNDTRRPVRNLAKNISNLYGQRVNVMQPQLIAQPNMRNMQPNRINVGNMQPNRINVGQQPYMRNNNNSGVMVQPNQKVKFTNYVGKINYPGGLNNIKIQPTGSNAVGSTGTGKIVKRNKTNLNKNNLNKDNIKNNIKNRLDGLEDLITKLKKQATNNTPTKDTLKESFRPVEIEPSKPIQDTAKDPIKPVEIEPFDLEISTPEIDESIFDTAADGKDKLPNQNGDLKDTTGENNEEAAQDKPMDLNDKPIDLSDSKPMDLNDKPIDLSDSKPIDLSEKPINGDSDLQEITKPIRRIRKKRESAIPDRSIKNNTKLSVEKSQIKSETAVKASETPVKISEASATKPDALATVKLTTTKTVIKTKILSSSTDENSTDFIVPKRSKMFLKKHNTDILSADKARKSYIDYKILESKDRQLEIEKKLHSLEEIRDRVQLKLSGIKDERDNLKLKIEKIRGKEEDESKTMKNIEEEIEKSEGQIKLELMEISKLEKALSEEKSKYSIMVEQQKVFKNRLERSEKRGMEVELHEKKLEDYESLLRGMEQDFERLKKKIGEVEERRKKEIENQNRLEVERKEIEDSGHIPLFAIYD